MCNLCEEVAGTDRFLAVSGNFTIIFNKFPYLSGHIMIISNKHTSTLQDLAQEELAELFSIVAKAQQVLMTAAGVTSSNIGINTGQFAGGSIPEHLHVHIVPRKSNDINFLTTTSNYFPMSDVKREINQKIKDAFKDFHL